MTRAANSFAAGAKYWTCACGQANAPSMLLCRGCWNPQGDTLPAAVIEEVGKKLKKLGVVKPRQNKTEQAFGLILEAQLRRGDIEVAGYEFEALTLHWGKDEKTGKKMRYKPDFLVRRFGPGLHRVIEVKGGHIFSRDLVRFRGCRAEWQWLFDFELHQKTKDGWNRLE